MTLLEHFVASSLARAIGWTILHSLWQGGVVAGLLAMTLFTVRSPRARYAAACGALGLLLCGFAITLAHFLPVAAQSPQAFKVLLMVRPLPRSAPRSISSPQTKNATSSSSNFGSGEIPIPAHPPTPSRRNTTSELPPPISASERPRVRLAGRRTAVISTSFTVRLTRSTRRHPVRRRLKYGPIAMSKGLAKKFP